MAIGGQFGQGQFGGPQQIPGGPGVPVSKPKSNIYTMMLFLSFIALSLAITMLCLEMQKYDWKFKADDVPGPSGRLDQPAAVMLAVDADWGVRALTVS